MTQKLDKRILIRCPGKGCDKFHWASKGKCETSTGSGCGASLRTATKNYFLRIRGEIVKVGPAENAMVAIALLKKLDGDHTEKTWRKITGKDGPSQAFGQLATDYLERHAAHKQGAGYGDDKRMLEKDVLPLWGDKPADEIERRDVVDLLDAITLRGPVTSNRTRALLHKVFAFAIARDVARFNPVAGTIRNPESSRSRVLTDEEIRIAWNRFDALPTRTPIAQALMMILATGQRPAEVVAVRNDEIIDGIWYNPATKNAKARGGKPHAVPLNRMALEVLLTLDRSKEYIFQSRLKKDAHMTRGALTQAIGDDEVLSAMLDADGVNWTSHDLRRTAQTIMAKLGFSNIADRVTGHALQGMRGIYDQHDYLKEKRDALDALGEYLAAILSQPAKVEGE